VTLEKAVWVGLLSGRREDLAEIVFTAPIAQSRAGGSSAFLAYASDSRRYCAKTLNSLQHPRVSSSQADLPWTDSTLKAISSGSTGAAVSAR